MTMAAALIAAVSEIDLKRFKVATVQCRESVCVLSVLLLSRWGDGGQGEGVEECLLILTNQNFIF